MSGSVGLQAMQFTLWREPLGHLCQGSQVHIGTGSHLCGDLDLDAPEGS